MAKSKTNPTDLFTSRTWKVLAASRDRDGYAYSGGEAGAVASLIEAGMVKQTQIGPRKVMVHATPEGRKAHDAYLASKGHNPLDDAE